MNKKIFKIGIIIFVILLAMGIGFNVRRSFMGKVTKVGSNTVFVGLPPNQTGIIKEYSIISEEYKYVDKGYEYLKEGDVDKAIEQFNIVLKRNRETGALGAAKRGLIDAYEKAKDYRKAAELLRKKISTYKVNSDNKFRIPDDERLKYLEYAAAGHYDLAVEYAKKALEADTKLPNRPSGGSPNYIERLNDIIAAKNYILSLKQQK